MEFWQDENLIREIYQSQFPFNLVLIQNHSFLFSKFKSTYNLYEEDKLNSP